MHCLPRPYRFHIEGITDNIVLRHIVGREQAQHRDRLQNERLDFSRTSDGCIQPLQLEHNFIMCRPEVERLNGHAG